MTDNANTNADNVSSEESTPPKASNKKHRRFGGHRSPVTVGGMGILILLMATVSAFYLNALPLVGQAATYTAKFTEAAGLKSGNEVRVAGVKVGEQHGSTSGLRLLASHSSLLRLFTIRLHCSMCKH